MLARVNRTRQQRLYLYHPLAVVGRNRKKQLPRRCHPGQRRVVKEYP